jgi:hypothetical protein
MHKKYYPISFITSKLLGTQYGVALAQVKNGDKLV